MPLHRRKDLELRSHADTIDVSMDSIDKDLDGIIADENSENTSNANALTIHKTSSDHDGRYYTESEWDTKETNILLDDESGEKHYHQAYARLLNPVFHLPLKNSIAMKRGVGSLFYTDDNFGDEYTYRDRYGVLHSSTDDDTPRFSKYGLQTFYSYISEISYIGMDPDFNDAAYTQYNITITVNDTNDPLGRAYGDKIEANQTFHNDTYTLTIPMGYVYDNWVSCFSIYAKKGTTDYLFLGMNPDGNASYGRFNLDAGTCEEYSGTCTVDMEAVQDGWYRCMVRVYAASGSTTNNCLIAVGNSTGEFSYQGNNEYLYIWGAQCDDFQSPSIHLIPNGSGYFGTLHTQLWIPQDNVPYDYDGWTFAIDIYFPEFKNDNYDATYRIFNLPLTGGDYNLGVSKGYFYIDNQLYYPTDGTQRVEGGFKRIVQTRDATTTKVYVNGVKYIEQPYTPKYADYDMVLNYTLNNAHISNIRFYDFVVTDEEARIL